MNQWIKINYKPDWDSKPNYWDIWFYLNQKEHREKSPSWLNSNSYWEWYIHNKQKKGGFDFGWNV